MDSTPKRHELHGVIHWFRTGCGKLADPEGLEPSTLDLEVGTL